MHCLKTSPQVVSRDFGKSSMLCALKVLYSALSKFRGMNSNTSSRHKPLSPGGCEIWTVWKRGPYSGFEQMSKFTPSLNAHSCSGNLSTNLIAWLHKLVNRRFFHRPMATKPIKPARPNMRLSNAPVRIWPDVVLLKTQRQKQKSAKLNPTNQLGMNAKRSLYRITSLSKVEDLVG